jgi:hypothetical protein
MSDNPLPETGLEVVALEAGVYDGRLIARGEKFRLPVASATPEPERAPKGGVLVRASAGPHGVPNEFAGTYRHEDGVGIRRNHGDVFVLRAGDFIGDWMEPGRLRAPDPAKPDETAADRFVVDRSLMPGWKPAEHLSNLVPHMRVDTSPGNTFSEINKRKDQEDLALARAKTAPVKGAKDK